jgi:hypothetical protein
MFAEDAAATADSTYASGRRLSLDELARWATLPRGYSPSDVRRVAVDRDLEPGAIELSLVAAMAEQRRLARSSV